MKTLMSVIMPQKSPYQTRAGVFAITGKQTGRISVGCKHSGMYYMRHPQTNS